MKRNDFLKLLGTGGGSFLLSGFGTKDLMYDLQEIVIYDNYVRGTNFYRKDFLQLKLNIGDPLVLQREKENIHDRFAIEVLAKGKKIGYIPAYENVVMANMMDRGVSLNATISETNKFEKNDHFIKDIVAIKITTKLMVPMQKIIEKDLTQERADNAQDRYRQGGIIYD
ncbi:MAG: HIRAN domain-containing protein [Bacteroidetes bacterium]|nr:HIRAN domain-containing protein [Bacteroidota bacterium]